MKYNIALLILLVSQIKLDKAVLEENVYILTDKNGDKFIAEEEFVFVKFYAPWCGHCKKMAPDYKELGAKYNVDGSRVKIAKVDSTIHKEFSGKYGIEGFPTLKLFVNGEPIDYSGERTKDAITSFISNKIKSEISILRNKKEVEEQSSADFSVVFLIPEGDDKLL